MAIWMWRWFSERLSNKHASQFLITFEMGNSKIHIAQIDKVLWMISSSANTTGAKMSQQPHCKRAAIHHGGAILRRFLGKISSCHPLWILNYDLLEKDKFQTHNENCIYKTTRGTRHEIWMRQLSEKHVCLIQPSIRLSKPISMFKAEKWSYFQDLTCWNSVSHLPYACILAWQTCNFISSYCLSQQNKNKESLT